MGLAQNAVLKSATRSDIYTPVPYCTALRLATPTRRRPRSLLDISTRSSRSRLPSGTRSSRSRLPSGTCSSRSRLPSGTCIRVGQNSRSRRTQPAAQQRLHQPPTTHYRPDFFTLSTLPAFSAKRTCASYLHPAKGLAPSRNSLIPFPAITKAREKSETTPSKRPIFLDLFRQSQKTWTFSSSTRPLGRTVDSCGYRGHDFATPTPQRGLTPLAAIR